MSVLDLWCVKVTLSLTHWLTHSLTRNPPYVTSSGSYIVGYVGTYWTSEHFFMCQTSLSFATHHPSFFSLIFIGRVTSLWLGMSVRGSRYVRLAGRSVFHSLLKGREDNLPCSYRSTDLFSFWYFPISFPLSYHLFGSGNSLMPSASVGWLVGQPVCHDFKFHFTDRRTCFSHILLILHNTVVKFKKYIALYVFFM